MAISPITSPSGQNGGSTTQSTNTLDMNTFLTLLTSQLSNQDPLEPMSSGDFASQLAQLGTVQGMDNLQKLSQVSTATSLLGRTVTVTNPNITGTTSSPIITGTVVNILNKQGSYTIGVKDSNGNITNVNTNTIQSVSN